MPDLKTLSADELKERAKAVFEKYKKAKKVAVTSDGECFIIDETDQSANNHAKRNVYKKELDISVFKREEIMAVTPQKKTVEELIAEIEAAQTVEELKSIVGDDEDSQAVIEACNAKYETLNAPK